MDKHEFNHLRGNKEKQLYVIMSNDYPAAIVSASSEEIAGDKAQQMKQEYISQRYPNDPKMQHELGQRMYWRACLEPFFELD